MPFAGFLDKHRFSADDADYSQQRYCRWQLTCLAPLSDGMQKEKHTLVHSSCGVQVAINHTTIWQHSPQRSVLKDASYLSKLIKKRFGYSPYEIRRLS